MPAQGSHPAARACFGREGSRGEGGKAPEVKAGGWGWRVGSAFLFLAPACLLLPLVLMESVTGHRLFEGERSVEKKRGPRTAPGLHGVASDLGGG